MALIIPFRSGGGIPKINYCRLPPFSCESECRVTGYYFIGGFTLTDAFYMTVITLSTVGFKEVHPLDDARQNIHGDLHHLRPISLKAN